MSRRGVVVVAAAAAVLAAVPAVALLQSAPESGRRGFRSTNRTVAFRTTPVSTSETRFRRVPGLDDVLIQNRGVSTARFSGDFSGGPVDIRIIRLPNNVLLPGDAHFAPTAESSSFSYDFLDPRRKGGIDCRRYAVSWRSPTGAEVTLNHGSLIVDYHFDNEDRDGLTTACVD